MTTSPSPRRASTIRAVVIIAAIAVPLVPAGFWLGEVVPMMPAPLQAPELGLYMLARLFALTGFVLMFYQFVLTARLPFLEAVLKRPRMIRSHRLVGRIGFLLMLAHGIILLAMDPSLYTEKTLGLIALILLTVAVVAAWFFRPLKLSLKTWRSIHLLAYLVFPLVFVHAITLGATVTAYRPVWWLLVVLFGGYCLILVYRVARISRSPGPRRDRAR